MNNAIRILTKLQEVNELLAEARAMGENLAEVVPLTTANALQIELTNLKESAYILDRDVTAWCEGTPGTEDFINEITGTQGWY